MQQQITLYHGDNAYDVEVDGSEITEIYYNGEPFSPEGLYAIKRGYCNLGSDSKFVPLIEELERLYGEWLNDNTARKSDYV